MMRGHAMDAETSYAWARSRAILRGGLGEDVWSCWFGCLELDGLSEHEAFLSVPTKFLRSWISSHYLQAIVSAMHSEFPAVERVTVDVRRPERHEHVMIDVRPEAR